MPKASTPPANTPIDGMSFETALAELESIVEQFESGAVSLDDAVAAYARGTELKQHCQKRLDEAKMRVDSIRGDATGIAGSAPLDSEGDNHSAGGGKTDNNGDDADNSTMPF